MNVAQSKAESFVVIIKEMVWKQKEMIAYALSAIIENIISFFYYFLQFLTWKIFIAFQVVVVGRFHSISPSFLLSFPVRHLETEGTPI